MPASQPREMRAHDTLTLDDFTPGQDPQISQSASGRLWQFRETDPRSALDIAQRLGVEPALASILASRGVTTDTAENFLNPSLRRSMPDPFVLTDMEKGAARIADAILKGEKVGVFGDYDVDGVTASAILKLYFNALEKELLVYLPDRITEGYGPTAEAFLSLKRDGADLIITVDCGASAHEPIEKAVSAGAQVVVIDHHLMASDPPAGATAVINPNRHDDISGLGNLSAAGVAFMTIVAVNRMLRDAGYFGDHRAEPNLITLLDLTALGLVCDVMDLTGLTRTLVAQGLKVLDESGNIGLRALGKRAGMKGAASTYHLGFLLGPRINAAGRIGHARAAFDLLTTQDPARATALAEELHVLNAGRREIEADVQEAALKEIQQNQRHNDELIVTAGRAWHPGVIGIVAGRIKELFDRPVIVISTENGIGKGSGRSIKNVDLGSAISAAVKEGLVLSGGGHAMAAGLSVSEPKISALRKHLNDTLSEDIKKARLNQVARIDVRVAVQSVTKAFHDQLASAGPYGQGNPEPQVLIENVKALGVKIVGENHLSLTLQGGDGSTARAIAFRAANGPIEEIVRSGRSFHVLGRIKPDDWRGAQAAQLQISDAAFPA